ncbi:MAG: superoxide dismutase family protein [Tepidisphaeraceae bacterium]
MIQPKHRAVAILVGLVLTIGCKTAKNEPKPQPVDSGAAAKEPSKASAATPGAIARVHPSAAATTQPVDSNITGTVTFAKSSDGVVVTIDLSGFAPNSTHGFHVHEKSDLSAPDLSSAGPHFNPAGHKHGGLNMPMSHAGDFGNITADANGNVHATITSRDISIGTGPTGVVGRSVIVHAKPDDLRTDPSGNSGARVAGGVIELQR